MAKIVSGDSQVAKGVGGSQVVEKPKQSMQSEAAGSGAAEAGAGDAGFGEEEGDDDFAAFFQDASADDGKIHEIKRISISPGFRFFRLGPEYIDEEYFDRTPVPLYQQAIPILDYDVFLEKSPADILVITPIRPQTFSALFALYRDRGPALNFDPNLTDLEEECFFQEVISFPTSKLAYAIPREKKKNTVRKTRVKITKPGGEFVVRTRLFVDLQESQTYNLLDLTGALVLESYAETYTATLALNEKYLLVLKHHQESDSYANDCTQTFENYKLSQYTDYKISGCCDVGTDCHFYFIEDEYKRVHIEDEKKRLKDIEDDAAREAAEAAALANAKEPEPKSSDEEEDDSSEEEDTDVRVDLTQYKHVDAGDYKQRITEDASEEEIQFSSDDDEEFEINFSLENIYQRKEHVKRHHGPRVFPDISFTVIALERIICMDAEQHNQAEMRGFGEPEVVKVDKTPRPPKPEEEGEEGEGQEAMDEDAIVDLLIQQHRLQEEAEREGEEVAEEAEAVLVLPPEATDADLEKIRLALEDADSQENLEGDEEEGRPKVEEVKVEEKKESVAPEEEVEEKDEFALALEETLAEAAAQQAGGEAAEPRDSTAGPIGGAGLLKDNAEGLKPAEEHLIQIETLPVGGVRETFSSAAPAKRVDDETQIPEVYDADQIYLSDIKGSIDEEDVLLTGKLRCEWDSRMEKAADMKEQIEEERAGEEVFEEEKVNLPAAMEDDDLSLLIPKIPKAAPPKQSVAGTLGYTLPEIPPAPPSGSPAPEGTPEDEMDRRGTIDTAQEPEEPEVIEVDDISDISQIDEDSRLSDHKGIEDTEISSTSSSEEDLAAGFREMVHRRSSANKVLGASRHDLLLDDEIIDTSPALKEYWRFKSIRTQVETLEITDIAIHPLNQNIFAVSYGYFRFGKASLPGLVCVWNAKNNRSPERIYELKAPGTTVAFSKFCPFILAVGMLDGNIVLYDVRSSDVVVLGNTYAQDDKHLGPVWQIIWIIEEDTTRDDSITESMLSLGDDGLLKRWSLTKGLESSIVMKVMRSTMQIPGRREKRSESLITTLSTAYTVCFFPKNTEQFLLGTEEGFIHKCASAYKDQFVATYVGHTGPVYRIEFSSFDETVFVSCGGDWTVKIWNTEQTTPLISLQTGHRTIFDVACSRYSSTVFISCNEFCIEVWDLTVNTLEPVVQHKPLHDVGLRKVAFNAMLNSVLIGDDDGTLTVYGLKHFPKPPSSRNAQNAALMEAIMPGYKRRLKDEAGAQEQSAHRASERLTKHKTSAGEGASHII